MNTPIKDGGRAFPVITNQPHNGGMTLRDWFAGMAMQGQISTPEGYSADSSNLATWSYQVADSMLAARKGEPTA